MDRKEFVNAKRIVVKLGTNLLRNEEGEVSSRVYLFVENLVKLVKNIPKV